MNALPEIWAPWPLDGPPLPCRLVTRISEDPHDLRHGVTRQRNECVKLAERLNWTITREHSDNDRSGC